jgi:hypothetical protein
LRSSAPRVASTIPAKEATPAAPLSDFGWGFERYPGYDFVGMSMDGGGQILVHQFQAQGHNNTKDPIVKVSGIVRSDRSGKEFPILFNLTDGKYLTADQLNPIPVDAIIDTRAYFSDNEKPIPLTKFLSDMVPFTFIFNYDGKTYRRRFTLQDIEPRIQRYEQDMRKMSVKPPQMSAKTTALDNNRYWPPLTDDEAAKLRSKLRELAQEPLSIWCNGDNCRDLAETVQGAFHEANWGDPQIEESIFPLNFVGISVAPDTEKTRSLANAIEEATAGRIVVRVESGPTNDKMINLTFGRKR